MATDLLAMMPTEEGVALAGAFQIENPKQRDALLKVAKAVANAD